ncbi:Oligoendopeptidase F, plasmid [Listeria grayi]|uniref:Oligopeptidase F n=2 Tax=Listeria grayi TaxID=1641 RepID=D7UZU6_LISGR|nr:oligoendopeptidase F [Listeria grayi]EFI82941.1 oligoendopeptidase F [Listeria grayi DSM 20601]EUJ28935.1 oligoendopeptidase F [Listeria grayi FSL F6-1183]MBC1921356.1 oligoendopeptidase F [Listeria grayi]VEI35679.1 Oligoendopeptidase F, plasmid [Listeria grayi]
MSEQTLPLRQEVPEHLTWDLTTIYKSDEEWESAFKEIQQLVTESGQYQGKLGESSETLLAALRFRDTLFDKASNLYVYAHLKMDQDTANPTYQSLHSRAGSLISQLMAAVSYFDPEILSIDEAKLAGFLEENADLRLYEHLLDELSISRPYILSEKEEALLASAGEVLGSSSDTFNTLNNADIKFPTIKNEDGESVEITHGRYGKLLESKDRSVREAAFKGVYQVYEGLKNTLASTLSGQVKKSNFYARVRGYKSAREAALSGNHIPEEVYDSLLESVNNNLPLLHRYVKLRQQLLGIEDLRMYDLYTPLSNDVDLNFTYEEAKEVVLEGLKPLGEEYQAILKEAFDSRWIDVTENKGKRSGAYSSGAYSTSPYILLNWQDNIDNVFTLAHELGHSVHSYYTRNNQPFIYGDYSIFLAEVASTTNENLLTDYLLKKYDDPKIRAYLLNHYLDGFKGTVFRQSQFAEFEHKIHQADQGGEALTADYLTETYADINKKFYGTEVMHYDKEIGYEWSRIPHFYMNYYVFQYATGFSAASALSQKILDEGQSAVDDYIAYLKAGNSDFPIDVLKKAGVDMTTSKPVDDALVVFEKRLTELETLVNK